MKIRTEKILRITFLMTIVLNFYSCNKSNKENLWGFEIGMTNDQIDSVVQIRDLSLLKADEGFKIYEGMFDAFGIEWKISKLGLNADTLCYVELLGKGNQDKMRELLSTIENNIDQQFPYRKNFPAISKNDSSVLWNREPYIVYANVGKESIMVKVENYSEVSLNQFLLELYQKEIDQELMKLEHKLIDYPSISNTKLKEHTEKEIIQSVGFLDSHKNEMTESQQDLYRKLKEIRINQ